MSAICYVTGKAWGVTSKPWNMVDKESGQPMSGVSNKFTVLDEDMNKVTISLRSPDEIALVSPIPRETIVTVKCDLAFGKLNLLAVTSAEKPKA